MRIKFEIEFGSKKDANSAENVPASESCEKNCAENGQEAASKKKSDNFIAPFWKVAKTPVKAALYGFGVILCLSVVRCAYFRRLVYDVSQDSYIFISSLLVAVAALIPCAIFIFATRKRVPEQASVEKEEASSIVANLLIVLSVLTLVAIAAILVATC